MQSIRTQLPKRKTSSARLIANCKPTHSRKNMSFFAHPFFQPPTVTASSSFHPLFRLLDDFDSYTRCNQVATGQASQKSRGNNYIKNITPRFDVQEHGEGYELHGEFPGIDQKDVEIEFTDENVLTVRAHSERHVTSSGAPDAHTDQASNDAVATPAAITTGEEGQSKSLRSATVEDEVDESASATDAAGDATPAQSEAEVAQVAKNSSVQQQTTTTPSSRYWVSERSVGSFSRSFTFPVRVDAAAVEASMRHGVLRIWVPKAKKVESRKITIS